jgi:WD40 repeat protein
MRRAVDPEPDVKSDTLLNLTGHIDNVNSVSFSPDGERLASGDSNGTVKVWDASTGQETRTLKQRGFTESVCFSPDGKRLAAGGLVGIEVWDVSTGRLLLSIRNPENPYQYFNVVGRERNPHCHSWVNCVCFSPDGNRLASAHNDGFVIVWGATTGQQSMGQFETVSALPSHHRDFLREVNSVCFSPEGKRLAYGTDDGLLRVWDTATNQIVHTLVDGHTGDDTYEHACKSVCFSPDGKRLASGHYRAVKVWDTTTGELLRYIGQNKKVGSVCFSPNGKWLAGGTSGTAKVWDSVTGQEMLNLTGHREYVHSVSFSPDGERLASGDSNGTVKVWDVSSLATSK